MIVTALAVYPIKACRGIALGEAEVTRRGLAGDRLWMVADEDGKLLTQRNQPGLRNVHARFEGEQIVASAPGADDLSIPRTVPGPRASAPGQAPAMIDVTVWRYHGPAVVHEAGSAWFSSVLGRRAILAHMPDEVERSLDPLYGRPGDVVGFADGYPVHLTTEESLADASVRVGVRAGEPLSMARFRPNVVVCGAASPHDEDAWREIRIGEARLRFAKRCDRCVMTTIDPVTGARGPEPLRSFATYREDGGKVYFGVYLVPDALPALVRVGDAVEVIARG